MRTKNIRNILILSIFIIASCQTKADYVPLNSPPDYPELVGDAETDAVTLMVIDLQWRMKWQYARFHNGEITAKEYEASIKEYIEKIEQIRKKTENN